jgi:hypothetical protein
MKQNKILIIVLIASIISNVFFGLNYLQNKNNQDKNNQVAFESREKIAELNKIFITKVVATGGKISFEDRAKIEEIIKSLNDQAISEKWSKFIASENGGKAQENVLDILVTLTEKMVN